MFPLSVLEFAREFSKCHQIYTTNFPLNFWWGMKIAAMHTKWEKPHIPFYILKKPYSVLHFSKNQRIEPKVISIRGPFPRNKRVYITSVYFSK